VKICRMTIWLEVRGFS